MENTMDLLKLVEKIREYKDVYELYYSESIGAGLAVREHTRGLIDAYEEVLETLEKNIMMSEYDQVLEESEKNRECNE